MAGRKKLLLWTLAVVVWFFLHTLLLLLVISGMYTNQEEKKINKREETIYVKTHRSHAKKSGFRAMTPFQPLKFESITETTTRNSSKLHFTPDHWHLKNRSVKYIIKREKMARLNYELRHIMRTHWRPDDSYYGFNVSLSEQVPVDRDIPDNRAHECKTIEYDYNLLPTVSVVTPVHNEALSTLVRHVFAILKRTPNHLLKDIILVDDNSTFTYLGTDLDHYFSILDPRIKILRNNGREGLVKSRLHGADAASGDVIVFLDAHMEVGPGWSEPLLHRLNSQSAIVVQPDVPVIDGNTFAYETGSRVVFRGGFGWDMRYAWFFIPPYVHQMRTSNIDPVPTPVLVGCAIAVKKSYFNSIGRFDPGLQIWGGEHFDLSFRVWTSGGRVETIPCSKIGHVFKSNKYSYGPKGKQYILSKNLLRVAEIWMDEYTDIVKATMRDLNNGLPVFTEEEQRSIEERRKLKRDLKCKDFTWYLKHVMPEMKIPSKDARWFGEVTNVKTDACWSVLKDGNIGMTTLCFRFRIVPENTFTIDKWGRLLYENKCVGVDPYSRLLRLTDCPCIDIGPLRSKWKVGSMGHIIYVTPEGSFCATHVTAVTSQHNGEQMVQGIECKDDNYQKWSFMHYFKY